MPTHNVSVQVLDRFAEEVAKDLVEEVVRQTLDIEHSQSDAEVSVLIADDETVRELNRRYRGLDENTDVLSFSFTHQGHFHGRPDEAPESLEGEEFVLPPSESEDLGEVIVSLPQTRRQAVDNERSVDEELALLLAHGVLHLLGHDHEEPTEEEAMKRIEAVVLGKVQQQA